MGKWKSAIYIAGPALMALVVIVLVMSTGHKGMSADTAQAPPAVTVQVSAIQQRRVPLVEEVPGTVAAIQHAEISPKVMSHIAAIYVHEGEHVSKGQLLARLESRDMAVGVQQAGAGLQNAEAAYAQSKTAYAMQRTQSTVSIQQAEAALEQAKAQLAKAKQGPRPEQIAQADEAVTRAQAGYEQTQAYLDLAKEGARTQQKHQADQAVLSAQQQVAQAEAALSAAQANLLSVQADYTRIKTLYEQDIVARQKLDYITAQLETVKSGVKQAEAAVNLANSGLAMAKEQSSMVYEGARAQEILAAQKQVEQAKSGYEQAKQEAAMAHQGGRWEDTRSAEAGVRQADRHCCAARAAQGRDAVSAKDVTRAQAGIAQATGRSWRAADHGWATRRFYAPFSGVITGGKADPGSMAMPQMPILAMDDDSLYQLVSNVPEQLAAKLTPRSTRDGRPRCAVRHAAGHHCRDCPERRPCQPHAHGESESPRMPPASNPVFRAYDADHRYRASASVPDSAVVERNGLTGVYVVDDADWRSSRW